MKPYRARYTVSYGAAEGSKQHWKQTNEGWPEPNDWIQRLCASLEVRYGIYEREPDPILRRNKAASMLAEVLSFLHELPPIHNGHAHMPLKDLLQFLNDLDRGRAPAWAKPTNFGGTSALTTAESELRFWVHGVVHVIWSTGVRKTEAYKIVAEGLTTHGRRGKDGGAVPWRSVQQWCMKLGHPSETPVGRRILDWWQVMHCPHGYLVTNCDTGQWNFPQCRDAGALARHFADGIWSLPHLRDRF